MMATKQDLEHLRRSLELAEAGRGLVSPNPLVGCVITSPAGEVVGEGAYIYEDISHAEVIALRQAGEKARGGTAYVSLEPHSHHGRTPPCTDALINAGIVRVVCPIEDPNPLVSGKGFLQLRQAGIEVETGLLEDEALRQNEAFITWHQKGRPFVHLKLAMSLDGRISLGKSVSTTLSSKSALERVQEIRHGSDAIIVGASTAVTDDPSLTDRSGRPRRRPLVRVILDGRLRLPVTGKLADTAGETPVLVYTASRETEKIARLSDKGIDVIRIDPHDVAAVMADLYSRQLQNILVEGGTEVAGAFVDAGSVDRVTFLMAPIIIGGPSAPAAVGGRGTPSLESALRLDGLEVIQRGIDLELTGRVRSR